MILLTLDDRGHPVQAVGGKRDAGRGADITTIGVSEVAALRYKANLNAGSLEVAESHEIADLLLGDADRAAWKEAIVAENRVKTRSPMSKFWCTYCEQSMCCCSLSTSRAVKYAPSR